MMKSIHNPDYIFRSAITILLFSLISMVHGTVFAAAELKSNAILNKGQSLTSPDGHAKLTLQQNGNLVLTYDAKQIWSSNTAGTNVRNMRMRIDGNLVINNSANQWAWNSNTKGNNGSVARLQNNGNFIIVNKAGKQVWASNTCCYPQGNNNNTNNGNNNGNANNGNQGSKNSSVIGKWTGVVNWPNIALHSVLTPNKEVLTFGTDKKGKQGAQLFYDVWDPKKGTGTNSHRTLPNVTATDIFCTAPAIIPETGDILLAGGDVRVKGSVNVGIKDAFIFNSKNRSLKSTTSMANARWYATATPLANGEIFVHGGRAGKNQPIVVPEIFNPKNKKWRSLTGAANSDIITTRETRWFYPRNFLIPDGRIFGMTGSRMYYLTTQGKGTNKIAGSLPPKTKNFTSTAVMYQPGKILQLGGGTSANTKSPATKQAITVDVTGKNPVVKSTGSLQYGRSYANSTVLPTGEVLVTGGSSVTNEMKGVALVPEIWNPKTGKWRTLAKAKLARLYHSTALLLPDTRVLIAGGGAPGPLNNTNAEIFSPPYLFNKDGSPAKRLEIVNAPAASGHGKTLSVKYTIGKGQQKAVRATLIRLGSATHSFNMEQRFIELNTTQTAADQVNIKLPGSANVAPPGFYMLFLLDANNVPSDAHILKLNVPGGGNTNSYNDGNDNTNNNDDGNNTDNGNNGNTTGNGIIVENLTVNENAGNAQITVRLNPASNKTVKVNYATKPKSAVSGGKDFRGRTGKVTFNPGQTSQTVTIPIVNDTVAENTETFTLLLYSSTNAPIANGNGTITIIDDDGGNPSNGNTGNGNTGNGNNTDNNTSGQSKLTVNNLIKKEGTGAAQVVVRLTPASNKLVRVNYKTVNENAKAGSDYTAKTGTLTFNAGQTKKNIPINIIKDNKAEGNENFRVVLSNPVNAVISDNIGIVRITD